MTRAEEDENLVELGKLIDKLESEVSTTVDGSDRLNP